MLGNASSLAQALATVGADVWAAAGPVESDDVIDLTVADPDLPTAEPIVERAVAALRAGDTHYTPAAGRPHVRQAVAAWHGRLSGCRVGAENVLLAPGAQCALYLAARCLAGPGDHIVAVEPYYLNYPVTLAATGAQVGFAGADPDSDFRLTEASIVAALKPNTKAIVLSNPNNPSGAILREDEVLALAAIARRHDLWLVCDEIYREICYEEGFASLASRDLVQDRLVILGSLSKTHAMAGWRLGWMIAPPPLIAQAAVLADVVFHGLPGFVQEAAVLALDDGGAAARDAAALYRRRRGILLNGLADAPGLVARTPQAGPFVFCDVRGAGLTGAEFARIARAEAGVALVGGGRFGHSSVGFIRIALTCPEETLTEAAGRLVGLCRRIAAGKAGERSPGARQAASAAPEFADGVFISQSGMVHVWRDGELDGIF